MTYRDLAKQDLPNLIDEDACGGVSGCPHFYLGAERPEYCALTEAKCRKCWDREIIGGKRE